MAAYTVLWATTDPSNPLVPPRLGVWVGAFALCVVSPSKPFEVDLIKWTQRCSYLEFRYDHEYFPRPWRPFLGHDNLGYARYVGYYHAQRTEGWYNNNLCLLASAGGYAAITSLTNIEAAIVAVFLYEVFMIDSRRVVNLDSLEHSRLLKNRLNYTPDKRKKRDDAEKTVDHSNEQTSSGASSGTTLP